MKTRISRHTASSTAGAEQTHRRSSGGHATTQLQASARLVAQRAQVEAAFGPAVQRQAEPEEELQMKAAQRMAPDEEELPLQGRFATVQRQDGLEEEEPLQGRFATVQAKAEPNQTGMSDGLKSGIESLSGMDMSAVRVHANSDRPTQLNALAYAQGNDIHLAPGQEQHLPHEAWHVVQQRQGRVQATTQLQGVGINDDHALESEADAMGARALGAAAQRKEPQA
jgi:Domain of unknown function (DUF4157)